VNTSNRLSLFEFKIHDNGLPFSLSLGCGSWGGNSIDENFNWQHLVNKTVIARPKTPQEPTIDEIFSAYFEAVS